MLEDSSCLKYRSFLAIGGGARAWTVRWVRQVMWYRKWKKGSVLGPLLFVLFTFELFHIVGNYIVGYADGATIYTVIARPLSRPQVMESLNQDLAAIDSWCLKWHMWLNPNKRQSMVVSLCQAYAPGYGDLTLGGLGEVKSLCIIRVTLDSKSTFGIHLREVVPKAARSLGVVKKSYPIVHVC